MIHSVGCKWQDLACMRSHLSVAVSVVAVALNSNLFFVVHFVIAVLSQVVAEEYVVAAVVNVGNDHSGLVGMQRAYDVGCDGRQLDSGTAEAAFVARQTHGVKLQIHLHHRRHHPSCLFR